MTEPDKAGLDLPRDLGDGLVLRWATPADTEPLADFNGRMHSTNENPDMKVNNWTRELMSSQHPSTTPADFTIVTDQRRESTIVSSMNLISQTWAYDDIPFKVGQPEAVSTDPEYRRKGLIRRQFEIIHALSAHRGEIVQVIGGIPWYYRQFGYDMALEMGGGRHLYWAGVVPLEAGKEEAYRMRPATSNEADMAVLARLYERHRAPYFITRLRDQAAWHYELSRSNEQSLSYRRFFIIEDLEGQPVGYANATPRQTMIAVNELAVLPGHSLREVALYLSRALLSQAEELNRERKKPLHGLFFDLGSAHPLYVALGNLLEKQLPGYAWYVRVLDVAAFLRHVGPVLEKRLAHSALESHSGALRLNFYRSHLVLQFEKGKLAEIGTYQPKRVGDGDAAFPDHTFLQLLFGYRSLSDLRYARADCYTSADQAAALLDILFPARPSQALSFA